MKQIQEAAVERFLTFLFNQRQEKWEIHERDVQLPPNAPNNFDYWLKRDPEASRDLALEIFELVEDDKLRAEVDATARISRLFEDELTKCGLMNCAVVLEEDYRPRKSVREQVLSELVQTIATAFNNDPSLTGARTMKPSPWTAKR